MPGLRACTRPVLLRAHRDGPADDGPAVIEVSARCWTWDCTGCGPGRRVEAFKLIRSGILEGVQRWPTASPKLVTITYPNTRDLRLDSAADLRVAHRDLRRFMTTLRATHHRNLEYVRVTEPTKRGRIHLHLVVTGPAFLRKCSDPGRRRRGLATGPGSGSPCYCTSGRPCVQRIAHALGMGWVKVQKVREPAKAAAYLGKYLAKGSGGHRWPRYARRLSRSREFGSLTFGALREQFIADVRNRRRLEGRPSTVPAGYWWSGPYPAGPRPPPAWCNPVTGEICPHAPPADPTAAA